MNYMNPLNHSNQTPALLAGAQPVGVGSSGAALLAEVEDALRRVLPQDDVLTDGARHLVLQGGAKRARPLLCAHAAHLCSLSEAEVVPLATAVELIHSASLLHDDVVDEGLLRRGRATVNAREGNGFAVLAGDLVLVRALVLLDSSVLMRAALRAVDRMTHAALLELRARGNVDFTLRRWREMAEGKTGALFGLCGELPALVSGDEVRAWRLQRAFSLFGIAFQIADDLLDLVGGAGKPRYADVREAQPSFPLLLACSLDESWKRELSSLWQGGIPDEGRIAALGERALALGVWELAIDEARACVDDARAALGPDRDQPPLVQVLRWADGLVTDVLRRAA